MKDQKTIIALLIIIVVLLAANLAKNHIEIPEAQANIVEGKNIFSTHSPDGTTVYLWGYSQAGSFNDATVKAYYYGKVDTTGEFKKN